MLRVGQGADRQGNIVLGQMERYVCPYFLYVSLCLFFSSYQSLVLLFLSFFFLLTLLQKKTTQMGLFREKPFLPFGQTACLLTSHPFQTLSGKSSQKQLIQRGSLSTSHLSQTPASSGIYWVCLALFFTKDLQGHNWTYFTNRVCTGMLIFIVVVIKKG